MLPYLLIGVLVLAGLLALLTILRPVRRSARRFHRINTAVTGYFADRTGLLRARIAALGVAIRRRHRVRIERDSARVPSGEPAQTGGRP